MSEKKQFEVRTEQRWIAERGLDAAECKVLCDLMVSIFNDAFIDVDAVFVEDGYLVVINATSRDPVFNSVLLSALIHKIIIRAERAYLSAQPSQLKLFVISANKNADYDTVQAFTILASDEKACRDIAAASCGEEGRLVWLDKEKSTVSTVDSLTAGVVMRDFHNG